MNTRVLMIGSAVFMLVLGVLLQFLPHEALGRMSAEAAGFSPVLAQMTGALLIGFAVMNWTAKGVLIGGIYARPLAIGNFAHFLIGGLTLVRYALPNDVRWELWLITILYLTFAIAFGYVFFTHPGKKA